MKIIVLEGPDGGGKSTLAHDLGEIGYTVKPFGVPPEGIQKHTTAMQSFFGEPLIQACRGKESVVFDRLHLSDPIYAPVMRGYDSPITPRISEEFDKTIESFNGIIVICLPPLHVAFGNWTMKMRRKEEYIEQPDKWREVYIAYHHLIKERQPRYLWYDYTQLAVGSFALALHAMNRNI